MKTLLIHNNYDFHYEIIESVIVKYREILNINKNDNDDDDDIIIYLHLNCKDGAFLKYVLQKYTEIKIKDFPRTYNYYINCTIYQRDLGRLDNKLSNKKYVSHEITNQLKKNPNVYFLTPLASQRFFYADILPFSDIKKETSVPIYIIQGNLNQGRRNLNLLKKILDENHEYKFFIKLVGRGRLPKELETYKNKIILRNNLNFIDFHKEFLDAYCILPLITKKTHNAYYTKKLTSSINYARGYRLKCLIDKDLQNIYNLDDVEVFNDINDVNCAFKNTLEQFYNSSIQKTV